MEHHYDQISFEIILSPNTSHSSVMETRAVSAVITVLFEVTAVKFFLI